MINVITYNGPLVTSRALYFDEALALVRQLRRAGCELHSSHAAYAGRRPYSDMIDGDGRAARLWMPTPTAGPRWPRR